MDEDGLELQPQEPNSFFDATGITWIVHFPAPTFGVGYQVDGLLDCHIDTHT